jgi:hypothetical protein
MSENDTRDDTAPPSAPPDRRAERWTIIGSVAGVAGVLVAVLALFLQGDTAEPSAAAPAPEPIVEQPGPEVPEPVDVSTSAPPPPAPPVPVVRRATNGQPIELFQQNGVDLDSLDPDWGTDTDFGFSDTIDIARSAIEAQFSARELDSTYYPLNGPGDHAACSAVTAAADDYDDSMDLDAVGKRWCIRTSEDRLALVELVRRGEPAAFEVTVWEEQRVR